MTKYLYVLTLFSLLLLSPFSTLFGQVNNDPRNCLEDAFISVAFSGDTIVNTCRDDDRMDRIRFQAQPFAQAFAYFVVDDSNVIQSIGFSNFVNFDMLPAGRLRVYAFSTYGRITASVGDIFGEATLSRPCAGLTRNFVTVNNGTSGDIVISSPAEEYSVCPSDGQPDLIEVSATGLNPRFVVTDEVGDILMITDQSPIDFEGASFGTCFIYAFSGPGDLPVVVGDNIDAIPPATGCGAGLSSNAITVIREGANGGSIATDDGSTTATTCSGDGTDDLISFVVTGSDGVSNQLIVTDDAGMVLALPEGSSFDFEPAPAGVCRVYSVSFNEPIDLAVGDNLNDFRASSGCLGLTNNFVTVTRFVLEGGSVATLDGEISVETCPGDGVADLVQFAVTGASGGEVAYLITNEANEILGVSTFAAEFDVEGAGEGVCRIWSLTYTGELTAAPGLDAATDELATECFELSDNFITVTRRGAGGGSIATADGSTEVTTCPADGNADVITFAVTGNTGANNQLVVTDDNGTVLALPAGNDFDFEPAPAGVCRVYSISFNDETLGLEVQDNLDDFIDNGGCIGLTSNFVTVTRIPVIGGSVATLDGETSVETCPGDGVADLIQFAVTGASGGEIAYLITNDVNEILGVSATPEFDVEGAGEGVCRIWSLTYQGELTAEPGQDAATAELATGCFVLSDNFIVVIRSTPVGGLVRLPDGENSVRVCPSDNEPDEVTFIVEGASGANMVLLISDPNNVLLGVSSDLTVDFSNFGVGVCRVWNLSYSGELLAEPGQSIVDAQFASACFDISDNFIPVIREEPTAGTVSLEDGSVSTEICPNDGVSDVLTFAVEGASDDNRTFVVTDTSGNVLALPVGNSVDFSGVPAGICYVYSLSYFGDLTIAEGDNVNTDPLASSCFDLSDNFITVIRRDADAGTVSTEAGETEIVVCPGDASPDPVRFDSTGSSLSRYNYLVADTNDVILQVAFTDRVDFERFPLGVCRVFGLAYDGVIVARPGDTLGVDDLASGCNALSENFVTVNKQRPAGGTVATDEGETQVMICPMDGVDDEVTVVRTGASGANLTYLITTDENVVLLTGDGPTFNFDNASIGVCRIWSLSYQGDLTVMAGDTVGTVDLSTGCSELSDNFITVVRMDLTSSTVSLAGGITEVGICPNDGTSDLLAFQNTDDSGADFQYVVTDEDDVVLALVNGSSFDFDPAGPGICRVWGFAFAGDIVLGVGDTVTTDSLATGCSALSDNFITVIRETPVGGAVSLADGSDSAMVCSGEDGESTLTFATTSPNTNYTFVVAREDSSVVTTFDEQFDFGDAPAGSFRIYGVAFGGNLTIREGQNIFTSELANLCFELSDNFVTIDVERVDGGMIRGNDSTEVFLCLDNFDDGVVNFTTDSDQADENYRYLITTASDIAQIVLRITEVGDTSFDFGVLPLEELRVYGVSYTGDFQGNTGTPLSTMLATGCLDLSDNFVTVFNDNPEAGVISFEDVPASGLACVVDGDGTISVATTSTSLTGYAILVTDSMNIVQLVAPDRTDVDLGSLPEGGYRVYGLAYTGSITVAVGDDLALVALADNCFELTDQFLDVTRGEEISAGFLSNVTTAETGDTITFCPSSEAPPIAIVESSVTGPNYRYIVTDTTGRIRAADLLSPIIPFNAFGPGEYRIYGFNFTGNELVSVNQNLLTTRLSTRCAALTSNFITVIFTGPDAGSVTGPMGVDSLSVEIEGTGTDASALVTFVSDFAGDDNFRYLITDADNGLLAVTDEETFNFGPAGVGICRVWGVAYAGELTVVAGEDVTEVMLASGCFGLSDGFLTVNRVDEVAGLASPEQVDAVDQLNITARPNPVGSGMLYLDLSAVEALPSARIYVRDMNGTAFIVSSLDAGSSNATVELDVSTLPTGIYFAQVATATGVQTVRFIKE